MKHLYRLVTRIQNNDPLSAPLRMLLYAASFGQRLGMQLRLARHPVKVQARVISVGNLTAGGTGKTPVVIERASRELEVGNQVAVITRGYGAKRSSKPVIHEPGAESANMYERLGDEATLIAKRVPGIWIVRCPNRVAAAEIAIKRGCTVLILDDGFQAVSLARDENIVLIDATNPFGNGHILPRGILREPLASLRRATEIIVTRCDQAPEALPMITATIHEHAPNLKVQYCIHQPHGLRKLDDGSELSLAFLNGTQVRAVCGIGNPKAFEHTLRNLGAILVTTHTLADHAAIPAELLGGEYPVILTEKDAIRLADTTQPNIYALCISMAPYPWDTSTSTSR